MTQAAYLSLVVDSTSVEKGDAALDKLAATGAKVEGSLKVDMGNIEAAMAALGVQIGKLDASMAQMARSAAQSGQASARTFDQLRASIDPAFAATQRYQQVQHELWQMVANGNVTWEQASGVLETAASRYMGVATAAERAAQAQQEAAAAVATGKAAYDSLRASVDPLFAASKRYEAALEAMNAAVKSGAITQQQANQVMQMTEAQLLAVAPKAQAAAAGQEAVAAASKGLFASVGGGQMAMKQMAFQLNQVAQQGAVTGNYIQALSVQSADLLTVFGTWGILAGGVIAVMGPLVMSLFGAGDNTKALKDAMDNLSDSVANYKDMAERAVSTDLGEEFGRYAGQARDLYGVLRDLGQLNAAKALREVQEAIMNTDLGASASKSFYNFDQIQREMQRLSGEFDTTEANARRIIAAINGIGSARGAEQTAQAMQWLNALLKEVYGSTLNIPPALQELATQAANGNMAALQILSTMDGVAGVTWDAANAAASLAARLGAAAASGAAEAKDRLAVINAQIAAVNAGQDEVVAGKRRQLELDRQAWQAAQAAAGMSKDDRDSMAEALFIDRERVIAAEAQLSAAQKARQEAEREGKRGAKSGAAAAAREEKEALREAAQWYERTRTGAEKYADTKERLNALMSAGVISQDTYNRALKQAAEGMHEIDASSKRGVDAVGDLFMAFTKGGDAAKQALAQLLLQMAEVQMMRGLMGLAGGGGFFGWLGGMLTSANGNVIADGRHVTAYANGGIVNGPTVFPMRTGAGLMGEAGPEAIMPLSRTADGKLGVHVANGNAAPQSATQVQVIPSPYFDVRVAEVSSYGDAQTARMSQRAMPGAINDMQRRGTR